MQSLPVFDISVILIYLLAMVGIGMYFSRRRKWIGDFCITETPYHVLREKFVSK